MLDAGKAGVLVSAPEASPGFTRFLIAFVGTELAWVLRPFVGHPGQKFQVFRPRQGNFYESMWHSALNLVKERE